MFVCSFKASKLKYLVALAVCACFAVAVIALMPDTEHSVTVNGTQTEYEDNLKIRFDGIKSKADVVSFVESLGYAVDASSADFAQIKIPSKPDATLTEYNKIQKSQGFNLFKYKNKTVSRYTFLVTALPDMQTLPEDEVYLTVILYKNKVVGGDVCFSGENAEVCGMLK